MSAVDLAALRAAAEAVREAQDALTNATHAGFLTDDYFAAIERVDEAVEAFAVAASPAVVLALLDELEYWRKDSAAAWDKCEERRLQAERAEAALRLALPVLEEAQEALCGRDDVLAEDGNDLMMPALDAIRAALGAPAP